MADNFTRQTQLETILPALQLPPEIQVRCWTDADMPDIQRLSDLQGWPTHHQPEEVLASWRNAWPAIVATKDGRVIGYIRGLTDESITMHITDLLVDPDNRVQGIGRLLLQACHLLYPRAGINLVAEKEAIPFYKAVGYRYVGESYAYFKALQPPS
jgi:predicted N-acetyltransferase YhbS